MSAVPPLLASALERQDWPAVEALTRPVLSRMPATPWAAEALVRACLALGRDDEAEALLLRALPWSGREGFAARLLRERWVADATLERLATLLPEAAYGDDAIEDRLLAAVHAHGRREFERAATLARQTLDRAPGDAAALNHQARATHNLGREPEALLLFERAVQADPLYSEGWHNVALARRSAGQFDAAIDAYTRAIALRPGFRSAALNLGKTLLALDRPQQALAAMQAWLERVPNDVDAMVHAGLSLHALQRLEEAREAYERALALDPGNGLAWLYLGTLHNQRMDRAGAGAAFERATQLLPRDGEAWAELAAWHELENRLDGLEAAIARGLSVAPGHPRLLLEAARLERRRGRPEAALQRLKALPPTALPPRSRAAYWFEAARSLDRLPRVREAMAAFTEANRNARAQRLGEGDAAEFDRMVDRLEAWPPDVESRPWLARESQRSPTFLLGFPRSGITLLNTMLGCHPGLLTLEERPTIEGCVARMAQHPAGYPGCLDSLTEAQLDALRAGYWRSVAAHAGVVASREVLDTFPLRTLHVAAIARLFPRARVIFMARHPADVVLSNFMQEYALNAANLHFTTLEASAQLYARTLRIWDRATARLPLRVHVLRYEDLVREPRTTLGGALDFLGLPWHDDVMTGHVARARAIRVSTSSYHQVAEPLYDRAVGRWQLYRAALEPVLPLLGDAARKFGYEI